MQRDSTHQTTLIIIATLVAITYESLTTIYYLLPPLMGLTIVTLFYYQKGLFFYLLLFFLLFVEANHMLISFSSWALAWFLIQIVLPILEELVACKICLQSFTIFITYIGYYIIIQLFAFLWGGDLFEINYLLLFYFVLVESLLSFILHHNAKHPNELY
jgi:hypothetical protein